MQLFSKKWMDLLARRLVPGVLVAGIAGWGIASGGADLEQVPGLLPEASALSLSDSEEGTASASSTISGTTAVATDTSTDSADSDSSSDSFTDGTYTDGTYTGSAQGFGGTITVSVTISGGKITAINVTSASGETADYLTKAKGVISKMLSAQSPNVDVVSGATYSSNGIINATKSALNKAKGGTGSDTTGSSTSSSSSSSGSSSSGSSSSGSSSSSSTTTSVTAPSSGWTDGTYTGSAQGFGGTITASVTVSGGKITAVNVTSHSGETASYYSKASAVIDKIVSANGTSGVDTISGATYSSRGIINAVASALSKAGSSSSSSSSSGTSTSTGTTSTTDSTSLPSDTKFYVGSAEVEKYGYTVQLAVGVSGKKIVGIYEYGDPDYEDNDAYMSSALNKVTDQLVGMKKSKVKRLREEAIDVASGATYSSHAVLAAVQDALTGKTETSSSSGSTSSSSSSSGSSSSGSSSSGSSSSGSTSSSSSSNSSSSSGSTSSGSSSSGSSSSGSSSGDENEEKTYTSDAIEVTEFDYSVTATVKVQNNAITDIAITTTDGGSNKRYINYAINGKNENIGIPEQLKAMTVSAVKSASLKKDNPTNGTVDQVSGATYTSRGILKAVQNALEKIQ